MIILSYVIFYLIILRKQVRSFYVLIQKVKNFHKGSNARMFFNNFSSSDCQYISLPGFTG